MFCNKKLNWIKSQVDSNVKLIINNLCIPALNINKLGLLLRRRQKLSLNLNMEAPT